MSPPGSRNTRTHCIRWSLPALLALCCGCEGFFNSWLNAWLDPTEVGNFEVVRTVEIRRTISELDEPSGLSQATDPTPEDLIPYTEEYRVAPGDVLTINVFELLAPGTDTNVTPVASNSGEVYVPVLGWISVMGKTAREIQAEIVDELRGRDILRNPEVQVTIPGQRQRVYHLFGVIARPGTYAVPKPDIRLMEALLAGGGLADLADHVYVFRPTHETAPTIPDLPAATRPAPEPPFPHPPGNDEGDKAPETAPVDPVSVLLSDYRAQLASARMGQEPPASAPSEPEPEPLDPDLLEALNPESLSARSEAPAQTQPRAESQPAAPGERLPDETRGQPPPLSNWIWLNGKWVEIKSDAAAPEVPVQPAPPAPVGPTVPYPPDQRVVEWESLDVPPHNRIIDVPADMLREGDARFNLVVRDGDTLRVTAGDIGQYYIMGHVNRPGVYSLTGQNVTIKQAIAASGGLDPLAWPDRCDVIRRVGGDRETTIPVNLDRIFAGLDPDFFLKPNDIINVGTNVAAPFLATIRSAFRLTYGFGFVWDRNFADFEATGGMPNPRLTRQALEAQRLPGLFP